MRRHIALFAALALALSAPAVLSAQESGGAKPARKDARHDRRDVRRDRKDIHQDTKDIHQDRKDVRDDRKDIREDVKNGDLKDARQDRSEEHTSELQSPCNLVCRLLLEKKKK